MKYGITKYLLKDIMTGKLPDNFIKNKKIGRPVAYSNIIYSNYFEKFLIQDSDILAAGPKTDLSA